MANTNKAVAFAGQFQAVVGALSKRLDKRGVSIVATIAQLAQSGSEEALDKIADVLAGVMSVFSNLVNYDDPRRKEIRKNDYTYVDNDLKPEHFPSQRTGTATVSYDYLVFDHEPTTQEVLDTIERRDDIRRPDRAETEDFLDSHPEEKDKYPVIGLCGSIVRSRGLHYVAFVGTIESGRHLYFGRLVGQWPRHFRFLVVRK